jgi:2-polyprenyl-3-methyl-5-hydroxy-6-metoxy-1,4-benzoquinol methylase
MDKTLSVHQRQYADSEFYRHTSNIDRGLSGWEQELIKSYLKPEATTLDIGCSGGRISFALESLGFHRITAIDNVEEFIANARHEAHHRRSNIEFRVGNILELPFGDESFEQIIFLGVVLSHLPHRSQRLKALREAHRVLKPGGIMLISAMNMISDNIFIKLAKPLITFMRSFHNPLGYEANALPRLGSGGKPDFLFFRPGKPQLYYYYPLEFISDIVSTDIFSIVRVNTVSIKKQVLESHPLGRGQKICAVATKKR